MYIIIIAKKVISKQFTHNDVVNNIIILLLIYIIERPWSSKATLKSYGAYAYAFRLPTSPIKISILDT